MMFLSVLRRRSGALALALLLAIVTLAAGIALLGVSGWFLTAAALAGVGSTFSIFVPSALVRGFSFIRILSRYGERISGHSATLSLLSDLRVAVFSRLVPLVPLRDAAARTGDFVARLTGDIETLDLVFLQALLPLASALFVAAGLGVMMAIWLPEAVPIVLTGFLATTFVLPLLLAEGGRISGAAVVRRSSELRTRALDGIDGHSDLVALGIVAAAGRELDASAAALRRARLDQARHTALGPAVMQLGAGLTLAGVLWVGLNALAAGGIAGPTLVGVLLATLAAFEVSGPVLRGAGRLGSALAAARRLRALAQSRPAVEEPRAPARLPHGGALTIDKVSFGYGERTVLDEVSLEVREGERVAILGESGSGKSTLLGLIVRLADVGKGSIRLAGLDLRDVATADLRAHVVLLTQDAPVFLGTIRDNLRIGSPFADDATLFTALGNARLDEFVRSLPDGLDTWLGQSGETLSAGQARRLCLARTLLSPAEIVLLDEPTSGLDADMEAEFLGDLIAATEGRTLILATHAVLPDRAIDRVFRLEAGRLSEA